MATELASAEEQLATATSSQPGPAPANVLADSLRDSRAREVSLQTQLASTERVSDERRALIEANNSELSDLRAQLRGLHRDKADLEGKAKDLGDAYQQKSDLCDDLNNELSKVNASLSAQRDLRSAGKAELATLKTKYERALEENVTMAKELDLAVRRSRDTGAGDEARALEAARSRISDLSHELDEAHHQINSLNQELHDIRGGVAGLVAVTPGKGPTAPPERYCAIAIYSPSVLALAGADTTGQPGLMVFSGLEAADDGHRYAVQKGEVDHSLDFRSAVDVFEQGLTGTWKLNHSLALWGCKHFPSHVGP